MKNYIKQQEMQKRVHFAESVSYAASSSEYSTEKKSHIQLYNDNTVFNNFDIFKDVEKEKIGEKTIAAEDGGYHVCDNEPFYDAGEEEDEE